MSNNNFSAGWNDPPMLGYTPTTKNAAGVRDMFSRRVAFPVNVNSHVTPAFNVDNQQTTTPVAHQPLLHAAVAPNGLLHSHHHNFSQTYLHSTDSINRSASSPCFSQENQLIPGVLGLLGGGGGGPFQIQQQQGGHVTVNNSSSVNNNHDQSQTNGQLPPQTGAQHEDIVVPPTLPPSNDILAAYITYSNEDIMGRLRSAMESCKVTIQPTAACNVEKRLAVLKSALDGDSLSVTCRERLCVLIGHLANHRYKEAYDIHSIMMIEHFSEVNPWMVGVKAVIMECLKKK